MLMNSQYHPSAPPLPHPSSSSSSITTTTTTATHPNGTSLLHNASTRPSTSHHISWQPSSSREEVARGGRGGSRDRHLTLERHLSAPTVGPSDNTGAGSRSLREASNGVGTRGLAVQSASPAASSSRSLNQYSAPPPSSPSSGLRSPRIPASSSHHSFPSINGQQWDSGSVRNHERGGSGQGYNAPSSGSGSGWLGPHAIRQPSTLPNDNKKDEAVEAAIRASRDEAQISQARRESEAEEEARLYRIILEASSYSAEQDLLRSQRLAEEERKEEEEIMRAMLQSQRDKGKARESSEERREREEMEMVVALSLSESSAAHNGRRNERGETVAEAFARLSRPSQQNDGATNDGWEQSHSLFTDSTSPPNSGHNTPQLPTSSTPATIPLSATSSHPIGSPYFVVNSDPHELPPPAYSPPSPSDFDDNPRTTIIGPGQTSPLTSPALRRSLTSPALASGSGLNTILATPPLVQSPPPIPEAESPRRKPSFATRRSSSINIPSLSSTSNNRPISRSSSYYSSAVAAAQNAEGSSITGRRFSAASPQTPRPEVLQASPDVSMTEVDEQDPFDDSFAAAVSEPEPRDLWDFTHPLPRSNPIQSSSQLPVPLPHPRITSSLNSSVEDLITTSSNINSRGSPLFGGLVNFSSTNALADEDVLKGIRFGFVPFERRNMHPPLESEGVFPDVCQLSGLVPAQVGSGGGAIYKCFGVEAGGWQSLLTYLMWHGNSHFEAAPSDLQAEKSGKGLQISITLEFFRSFSDHAPKIRCRVSLLPAFHSYDPLTEDPLSTTLFEPDCPNITIHLPIAPLLPITLSTLATTISKAHTVSRKIKKSSTSRYLQNPQERAIKDLSAAVDLFKRLNGEEVVEDAAVVEKAEDGLLYQIKGRLKRRRKGAVIVEGGADGGVGMPLGNSGRLPDGALLVTPFRLYDD